MADSIRVGLVAVVLQRLIDAIGEASSSNRTITFKEAV